MNAKAAEKFIYFKNLNCNERVPIVIYANLECCLKLTDKIESKTYISHFHEPTSYGYLFKMNLNIITETLITQFKIPQKLLF
jgi:hypothetical protein